MKIAIITCEKLPLGVKDDQDFFNELRKIGLEVDVCVWNSSIDWSQYDACLLRSVWDYHDNIKSFTEWMTAAAKLTTLINSKEVFLWNRNKNYLADLENFGITIAPTHWIEYQQPVDLKKWCDLQSSKSFFLKPVVGADSSGTFRFENSVMGIKSAEKHLAKWLPKVSMMLQSYIKSVETFGETSAIFFAGNLSHAVRKIPLNGDYRVQDTFGASDIPYTLNAAEMALSKACLDYLDQKFGGVLYARFDFLHDNDGTVYLNEVELIEPSLFFNHSKVAAKKFAQAVLDQLNKNN